MYPSLTVVIIPPEQTFILIYACHPASGLLRAHDDALHAACAC